MQINLLIGRQVASFFDGAIAWLSRNEETTARVRHGLVLAGVGDAGLCSYRKSRRGDADSVLKTLEAKSQPIDVASDAPVHLTIE